MKISELRKDFDGFSLNISEMQLERGKIHGLIGANGSGKTTLMKLIAGVLEPDSGLIDYSGLTPRDITMVARKSYLLHDTVYNNLVYPLKLRKRKPDNELVGYYLELAGLDNYGKKYAPTLSSGEQQKLALIRALIFSPKLVLLDEAFASMDLDGAAKMEALILENQSREPVTWLIISHQLSCIQRLCSHVFFIHSGKLETKGQTCDILERPQNSRLKEYLRYETIKERLE